MASITELEEAANAAFEDYKAATVRLNAAREAVSKAKLDATGLAGHLVSYQQRWGYGSNRKTRECKFVVDSIAYGKRLSGKVVKADGTLGMQRRDAGVEQLTDLGLFAPEVSTSA